MRTGFPFSPIDPPIHLHMKKPFDSFWIPLGATLVDYCLVDLLRCGVNSAIDGGRNKKTIV